MAKKIDILQIVLDVDAETGSVVGVSCDSIISDEESNPPWRISVTDGASDPDNVAAWVLAEWNALKEKYEAE